MSLKETKQVIVYLTFSISDISPDCAKTFGPRTFAVPQLYFLFRVIFFFFIESPLLRHIELEKSPQRNRYA